MLLMRDDFVFFGFRKVVLDGGVVQKGRRPPGGVASFTLEEDF
jgi:hypothetical protein